MRASIAARRPPVTLCAYMLRTVEPHRGFDYPTPDVPISVATRTVDSLGRHVPPLRLEPWSFHQPSIDRRSRLCRDRCRASGG